MVPKCIYGEGVIFTPSNPSETYESGQAINGSWTKNQGRRNRTFTEIEEEEEEVIEETVQIVKKKKKKNGTAVSLL